ncbi:MAG: GatB/YqeY domain-containing protein [Candidatus Pacebacteria bacterium]|nr:GatB/YqeY domain-containing protein [Candidatus Paceibacterota bacterium]
MLKQKIQSEILEAVKEKNENISGVLRLLLSVIFSKEKEKRYKIAKDNPDFGEKELIEKSELIDEEIINVIFSEVKKRKDAILEFEKGKRNDLIEKEKAEIKILEKYLPEQISEEEIKKIVEEAVRKTGASQIKDMGRIMAEVMPKLKGKADGSIISKIVKEALA